MNRKDKIWQSIQAAAFKEMFEAVGATGDPAEAYGALIKHYGFPPRAYHNLSHVEFCQRELMMVEDQCENLAAVEVAIWFHDAIYYPSLKDNEERSAALASELLCLPPAKAKIVKDLILDTKHNRVPMSPDGKILADIDLAILGMDYDIFEEYCYAIRLEYAWAEVDEVSYRKGRSRFLKKLLSREHIFWTQRGRKERERCPPQPQEGNYPPNPRT